MGDLTPLHGELQLQLMAALWRLQEGTVEQLRRALPADRRTAYTTVQTVLNRLAERGLVSRERRGKAIIYRARLTESEYLVRSIEHALVGASEGARRAVLARLIGGLPANDLHKLQRLAREINRSRRRR